MTAVDVGIDVGVASAADRPETPTPAARDTERVPLRRWLAVVAMAVGTFALVTVESLPVGLLPFIGSSLHVSEGTAVLTTGAVLALPTILAMWRAGGGAERTTNP